MQAQKKVTRIKYPNKRNISFSVSDLKQEATGQTATSKSKGKKVRERKLLSADFQFKIVFTIRSLFLLLREIDTCCSFGRKSWKIWGMTENFRNIRKIWKTGNLISKATILCSYI